MPRPIAAVAAAILFVGTTAHFARHSSPHHVHVERSHTLLTVSGDGEAVRRFIRLELNHYTSLPSLEMKRTQQKMSASFELPAPSSGANLIKVTEDALAAGLSYSVRDKQLQGNLNF